MKRRALLAFLVAPMLCRPQEPDILTEDWNEFAELANEWVIKQKNGIFDVKIAKKMTQAFHKLERNGYWPK